MERTHINTLLFSHAHTREKDHTAPVVVPPKKDISSGQRPNKGCHPYKRLFTLQSYGGVRHGKYWSQSSRWLQKKYGSLPQIANNLGIPYFFIAIPCLTPYLYPR